MPVTREQVEAYSRGEVTRRELAEQLDEPVSFGTLLLKLHEYGLRLPRFPGDPNSPGVQLITQLMKRGRRVE